VKWVSGYLLLIAFMLFTVEFSMIIPFLKSSTIPQTIRLTGNTTSIVFALDFLIVIPVSVIAAILLWQRRSWGFVRSIMMLVKGFTYGLVLSIGTASLAYSDSYGKWDPLMPLYVVLAVGGLMGCWLLLKNFKEIQKDN
jgi:CHASE2 domain-containing sensor protein